MHAPNFSFRLISMDFFDLLPDHLLTSILSFLPIKESARTSILSRRWRHQWTSITDFDIRPATVTNRSPELHFPEDSTKLIQTVDIILSSPQLTIHKFQILISPSASEGPVLARWAEELTRRGVKELSLINLGVFYAAPQCLLNSKSLTVLKLRSCELDAVGFSSTISPIVGCSNLKYLKLESVAVFGNTITEIVSTCKHLESLSLIYCTNLVKIVVHHSRLVHFLLRSRVYVNDIDIKVPNLEELKLQIPTRMKRISVCAPKVRRTSVSVTIGYGRLAHRNSLAAQLRGVLIGIENTNYLKLKGEMVQSLSLDDRFWDFAAGFHVLKRLCITVSTKDRRQTSMLAVLLRCCPQLQELRVNINHCSLQSLFPFTVISKISEELEPLYCLSHHLQQVEVAGFTANEYEMEMVKFLLAKARVLKSMVIKFQDDCSKEQVADALYTLYEIIWKRGDWYSTEEGSHLFSLKFGKI